jgi:hypothetical protein
MHNIVIENSLNVLVNSGAPDFATDFSEGDNMRGRNTIAYAGSPLLMVQNSAFPFLGYDYGGGYNSIFGSDQPDAWVVNNSGLYAANNYWTDGYPSCYTDGTSFALTTNPLSSNPNPDPYGQQYSARPTQVAGGGIPSNSNIVSADTGKDAEFQSAVTAAIHGDFTMAVPRLRSLIQSGSAKYAPLALLVYYDLGIGRWNKNSDLGQVKKDMYSFLQDLRSQPIASQQRPIALRLCARDAALSRNDSASNVFRMEILKDYPGSPYELATMYDLVVYYVHVGDNLPKAKDLVSKMISNSPDANLTYMARIEVGEKVILPRMKQPKVDSDISQVPKFALNPGYPNPFNPSTNIAFEIPKAAFVSLRVYDIMGREVALLVNEFKDQGRYSATWNASGMASGIYFSRIDVDGKSIIQKLVLMK